MNRCLTLLALFIAVSCFSQNYKYGKVSKEEIEEKVYPIDSTAEAAYLYTKRRSYYDFSTNDGFRIISEIHHRIKIYDKEGFKKATQTFRFYKPESGAKEKISSLQAATYNLEGNKVVRTKVSKKEIFEEKLSKYFSQKKITFPEIKEGSVIEFSYKLVSPYTQVIDELKFQHDIPVKRMECTVEIPEYFNFKQRSKGYYLIAPETSTGKRTVSWTTRNRGDGSVGSGGGSTFSTSKVDYTVNIQKYNADNIPALKDDEAYVNNIADYRGGIAYEINYIKFPDSNPKFLATSWDDVTKTIYSAIGPELDRSNYYRNDLAGLIQGATNDSQKIIKIFQFVKEKIKWNGYPSVYPDSPLKKAYKEGTGNVAVINLMLVSMLRSAGLDANPVLVSTKSNGVPLFPTRDGFNYVVAAVSFGDGFALMDASERYSIPNMLPPRAMNWQGRLITKSGASRWLSLGTSNKAIEDYFVSVKVDGDGMVEGMMRTKFSNLGALSYRNRYNKMDEEQLISKLEDDMSIEIEEFNVANKFDIGKPVTRTIKFTSEDLIEEINGKMYIRPLLFMGFTENPFKSDERKFPVEFPSPWKDKSSVTIQLPEGYTVESSPETKALGLPENLGLFKYQVVAKGNQVRVISIIEFNTATIPANYYETLKGFFGEFVKKQSEKIVLIKS